MNIKKERLKLTIYSSGFLLITQTIIVIIAKYFISSENLDIPIYFFGYFPVVVNALVTYKRSKYNIYIIDKNGPNLNEIKNFLSNKNLIQLGDSEEYYFNQDLSFIKTRFKLKEYDKYYEINCPKYLKKIIKS